MDRFARIASDNYMSDKEALSEVLPRRIEHKYFKTGVRKAAHPEKFDMETTLGRFQTELSALKGKMEKYMANHAPARKVIRKQLFLDDFDFRYEREEDKKDFVQALEGQGEWKRVAIPDYRGPVGKWTGFYRREFLYGPGNENAKVFLCFEGVDYKANVYLNHRYVGCHEGFFSPFKFDVTDHLNYGAGNVLFVEVKNDAPTLGLSSWSNSDTDGDKIYAATGPGWDDPEISWHHCPPGAGIYNKVRLEEKSPVFVHSVFVRPDKVLSGSLCKGFAID